VDAQAIATLEKLTRLEKRPAAQEFMTTLNETHGPTLRSWVTSANVGRCDFPIQNLPFGRFRRSGSHESWRIGTAIGDQILDLKAVGLIATDDMNALMAIAPADRHALRAAISQGLREGSDRQKSWASALMPQAQAEHAVPCRVGDYTDFYTGIHHATAIGARRSV
jgi:fumarylacetoacetase